VANPANVLFAELFWVTLDDQLPPNTETFNGAPLARVPCGPVTGDPCWPTQFAYAWHANVAGLLVPGTNTLSCFPDNCVLGGAPNTEGASLVIVYKSAAASKEIIVTCGNDLLDGFTGFTSASLNLNPFINSPAGVGAELTFITGDGQSVFDDEAYWNGGTEVALSGVCNAFQGLDQGPGTTAGGGGYWDTLEFGVGIGAPNTASVRILCPSGAFDCLNWVSTVLCVKRGGCAVPVEPHTWSHIKSLYR
jgi:hypothetical protein